MVTDYWPVVTRVVIIYNLDVAASLAVAQYYCAVRGIPSANLIGFNMGTNAGTWAYDASRFANFWTPLYEKVTSVGADYVLVAAGCPKTMHVKDVENRATTTRPLFLANIVGKVKIIHEDGNDPVCWNDAYGGGSYRAFKGSAPTSSYDTDSYRLQPNILHAEAAGPTFAPGSFVPIGGVVDQAAPQAYLDAITAAAQGHDQSMKFWKPVAGFDGAYRNLKSLPTGWIGWHDTSSSTTHNENVETWSKLMINRAQGREYPLAVAQTKPIVVGIGTLDGDVYSGKSPAAKEAMIVHDLVEAGFTNVHYFRYGGTNDLAANILAPTAGNAITAGNLDNPAYEFEQEYWLQVGTGFINDRWDPLHANTWRPEGAHKFPAQVGALNLAGRSDHQYWAQASFEDGGCGGITRGSHPNTQSGSYNWESVNALLQGRCLAEAVFWKGDQYADHFAFGDPLYRPIRV